MEEDTEGRARKLHRKRQSGPKAEKKKEKNKHEQDLTPQQRNPKAFSFHSVNKVSRAVRRTLDIREKKHHIPVVDRTPVEPPPVLVAVVGPPKVGKTTLIQCLIKNFTKHKLSTVEGPVTIVSGKKRRLTIIECNNDINSMIDLAKIADLVLLMVDASFGFEMETFEFLNICQVHGFPKIMGVLTHLDLFRNAKVLRKTKKRLKHRFWTEIYQGAKLFYLSGMVNGEYQKTEVHNLGRFISVMKFRPLVWRTTHPYILADRMEDVTDPESVRQNPKVDRSICLYGYVRGTHFRNNGSVHVPGCGDFTIRDMSFLGDPCPLPQNEKKRSLNAKERLIYAPMSGVGGIVYDKDAVYIDLGGSHSLSTQEEENKPANELVSSIIDTQQPLDAKIATSQLKLFRDTAPLSSSDIERDLSFKLPEEERVTDVDGRTRRKAILDDYEEEESEDTDDGDESSEEEDEGGKVETTPPVPASVKKAKLDTNLLPFADSDDDLESDSVQIFSSSDQKIKKDSKNKEVKAESQKKSRLSKSNIKDNRSKENLDKLPKGTPNSSQTDAESAHDDEECEMEDSSDEDISAAEEDSDSLSDEDSESEDDSSEEKLRTETNSDRQIVFKDSVKIKRQIENTKSGDLSTGRTKTMKTQKKSGEKHMEAEESGEGMEDCDDTVDSEDEEEEDEEEDKDESEDEEEEDENEDSDEDDEMETGHLKWKDNLTQKAAEAFQRRQSTITNYRKLVYGMGAEEMGSEEDEDEVGGMFKVAKQETREQRIARTMANSVDCSKFPVENLQDWDLEEVMDSIRDCFVTGKWDASSDAKTLLEQDDEMFGDFEDLETGETFSTEKSDDAKSNESDSDEKEEEKEDEPQEEKLQRKQRTAREKYLEKKKKLKELFDSQYDEKDGGSYFDSLKSEMEQQAQLNRAEFENLDEESRAQYEGFRPGVYVRVQLDHIPCEFVVNFDATYPIILGGLLSAEQNIGYVQVRLKKHRWYKKILKTRDPIIVSLGWRRFQSIALYSVQDHNGRHRLLKYTPEHLHCHATMWGPITPQGTGMLAIQTAAGNTPDFRVSATGVVLELDKSMTIVKKLKLTGTPYKIYKKTAFIKGMFNSQLEVAKFEGASIRSVSGIRGQIKKPVSNPEGAFRATFEDKLLLSDIVFVRTWYPVQVPEFYNPVTTLLLPPGDKNQWQGMKTVGQLRREKGIKRKPDEDSIYKPIERPNKAFLPLAIPRALQKDLPFKDKPKEPKKIKDPVQSQRIAVIREPKERQVAELMKRLKVLHAHKMKARHQQMRKRAADHQKQMAKIEAKRNQKQKEVKKQIFRVLGQMEKKKNKHRKD